MLSLGIRTLRGNVKLTGIFRGHTPQATRSTHWLLGPSGSSSSGLSAAGRGIGIPRMATTAAAGTGTSGITASDAEAAGTSGSRTRAESEAAGNSIPAAEMNGATAGSSGGTLGLTLPTTLGERWDLGRKRFVLIDLSGTLHVEDEATPGAVVALNRLRLHGYKILFVTNTTKESKSKLHSRLTKLGFCISPSELFTSLDATRNYVMERGLRPMLLVAEEAKEDFEEVATHDPNCVVVGLSLSDFNRDVMSAAMRLIIDKKAPLVAVHKGKKYKTSTGLSLGPGAFVVALEKATGVTATVLGKPEKDFYAAALKCIGCKNPLDAVMIGDDVRDDVMGSIRAGMTGILVKTGKFSAEDLQLIKPHQPDFVCNNFEAATKMLIASKTDTPGGNECNRKRERD